MSNNETNYRRLFEDSPICLWDADYTEVKKYINNLKNEGIEDFREYFNTHPMDVVKLANSAKIIEVNNCTLQLYGAKNHDEFLNRLHEVFRVDSLPAFKEGFIALAEGKNVFEGESITYTLQGQPVFIKIKAIVSPGYEETFSKIIFSNIDITSLKESELALRESEEKYRTIIENIEDGYWEVDIAGNFTFFNDSLQKMLGYNHDDMIGMNNRQYMDKETAKNVYQTFNQVYRTGESTKAFDWELIKNNGTRRVVETSISLRKNFTGKILGFRGLIRDITDRKRDEQKLRESEHNYREILEKMQQGIIRYDNEGCITYVNPYMTKLLGYPKEEMLGKKWNIFIHKSEQELIEEENGKMRAGVTSNFEIALLTKVTRPTPVWINATPLFAKDGTYQGNFGVVSEISEFKKANELLIAQKRELSNNMHYFSDKLAKELETTQKYTEILHNQFNPAYAEKILEKTRGMEILLENSVVLADSQIIDPKENQNLTELVLNVAENIIPKTIQVKLDNLPNTQCDPGKVFQLFKNLFKNAVEHGSPSKIEVTRQDIENGIEILVNNDGNEIDPKIRSEIFQRGFSTKENSWGLGLTIVRYIGEAHNWKISLLDIPETSFRIFIPSESL